MKRQGELLGIATREKSRAEMVKHDAIDITAEKGLLGDFRGRPGRRQVTVLSKEAWQKACDIVGQELEWTTRRANLLVGGLKLFETAGQFIQIGDLVLKITGETDPCGRMNEYKPMLMQALLPEWRGGVCCSVLQGSRVQVGDRVHLLERIES